MNLESVGSNISCFFSCSCQPMELFDDLGERFGIDIRFQWQLWNQPVQCPHVGVCDSPYRVALFSRELGSPLQLKLESAYC